MKTIRFHTETVKKGKANAIVSTRRSQEGRRGVCRRGPGGRWVSKVALPLWRFCTRASLPVPDDGVVSVPNPNQPGPAMYYGVVVVCCLTASFAVQCSCVCTTPTLHTGARATDPPAPSRLLRSRGVSESGQTPFVAMHASTRWETSGNAAVWGGVASPRCLLLLVLGGWGGGVLDFVARKRERQIKSAGVLAVSTIDSR